MPHVILVEDDSLLSEMYQSALSIAGYECSVAYDGLTGLNMIKSIKPDLVLLDLMLPQLSGDQVLLNMRQSDESKDTKVLIMTNISKSEAPEILDTLHFERYIVKANTTLREVIGIVDELLQSASAA